MSLSDAEFAAAFRRGAECYLREYGNRLTRERTAHFWLAICLAEQLPRRSTHCIIGELHTRKCDLTPYLPDTPTARALIKNNTGAFGYDICIARDDKFDARTWQTKLKEGRDPTREAISQMAVIAELKTSGSTATTARSIEKDLCKLLAIARMAAELEQQPQLFFIAAPGPTKTTEARIRNDVEVAKQRLNGLWPEGMALEIIM